MNGRILNQLFRVPANAVFLNPFNTFFFSLSNWNVKHRGVGSFRVIYRFHFELLANIYNFGILFSIELPFHSFLHFYEISFVKNAVIPFTRDKKRDFSYFSPHKCGEFPYIE